MRVRGRILVLWTAVAAAVLAFPVAACAAERLADGDFEATVCDIRLTGCTSPAWTQSVSGEPPAPAYAIGPLCGAPSVFGPMECFAGTQSGYNHGPHWARLGSSADFIGGDDRPPELTTSITQQVQIPAQPATLSFSLHIVNEPAAGGTTGVFRAFVNGNVVFSATDQTPGYATYSRVTVPLDGVAHPGSNELRFEGVADVDPGSAPDGFPNDSDTFDLDDVSLDAPDAPPSALQATGQSAARNCRKKKKHKRSATAAKKCKKKK
jgi:hypothetical protein